MTASFAAVGLYNRISLHVPLDGGPPFAGNDMQLFPNNQELQPGDSTELAVMTGGALSSPTWSASSTVGNPGTIAPLGSSEPAVFKAAYTSSPDPNTIAVKVTADAASSGGPAKEGTITLAKVIIKKFSTPLGGRMKPEGGTTFTITGKKEWPDGLLEVRFRQSGQDVTTTASKTQSDPTLLAGSAPPNNLFIGDAQVLVFQGGAKISKDRSGDAYYSFDPPSPATAVSPADGYNRLGGIISIAGEGFKRFGSINPTVEIKGLDFKLNFVNDAGTQINGLVRRAPAKTKCCQCIGQVPCKTITVTNPGGRDQDSVRSNIPLYNLKPGPPPIPQSRFPDFGFSLGGTLVTIRGENLDFVDNVTIGGIDAPIISNTNNTLVVTTLPHTAGPNNPIILFDVDNSAPGGTAVPGGGFRYDPTPVREKKIGSTTYYIVGPGEGVDVRPNSISASASISCISSPTVVVPRVLHTLPELLEGVVAFTASGSADCVGCTCSEQNPPCPKTVTGHIRFILANTAAAGDTRLQLEVCRQGSVGFGSPPPPPLKRTCAAQFFTPITCP